MRPSPFRHLPPGSSTGRTAACLAAGRQALAAIFLATAWLATIMATATAEPVCPTCSFPCPVPPCSIPNHTHPLPTTYSLTGFVFVDELGDFLWGVDESYQLYQIHLIADGPAEVVSILPLHPPAGNARASGLGRDRLNDLWVTCDRDSRNILFFDNEGNASGEPSMFPGVQANGVAVGPDQSLWVVDTFDSMIYRRMPDGMWVAAFTSPEGTNLTGLAYFTNLDGLGTLDLGTPPGAERRLIAMFLDGSCIEACDLDGPPILRGLAVGEFFPPFGKNLRAASGGANSLKSPPTTIEDYDVSYTGEGPGTPVIPSTWGELKATYR